MGSVWGWSCLPCQQCPYKHLLQHHSPKPHPQASPRDLSFLFLEWCFLPHSHPGLRRDKTWIHLAWTTRKIAKEQQSRVGRMAWWGRRKTGLQSFSNWCLYGVMWAIHRTDPSPAAIAETTAKFHLFPMLKHPKHALWTCLRPKRSETTKDSILAFLGKQKGRFPLCSHSTKPPTALIHSIKMMCTALYQKSRNTHTHTQQTFDTHTVLVLKKCPTDKSTQRTHHVI